MRATGWLIGWYLRRRWLALVPLALVVSLGGAGTLVAAGAADRTAGAYTSYLDRADVGDVVVNPSLNTSGIDRVLRDLPGVRSVTSSTLFFADIGERPTATRRELEDPEAAQGLVYGSVDGRYAAMDRPVLTAGRLPTGPGEVLINGDLAGAEALEVGDELPLTFWTSRDDLVAGPDDVVRPLAVVATTVVGIATFADEVLPDELFPRGRVVVSPELARRYDCLPDLPPVDAGRQEALEQVYPQGCSTSYRYYSLDVEGGAGGVARVLEAVGRGTEEANTTLPTAWLDDLDNSPSYYVVATTTADERARVQRSTQPIVTALGVLGLAAGAVTVVVLGLGVTRELRHTGDDRRQWSRLGLTRRQHAAAVAVPLLVAVTVGIAGAVVLAWLLSTVGPVGSVRSVEPSPGRELSAGVGLATLGLAVPCAVGVGALAALASRAAGRPAPAAPVGSRAQPASRAAPGGSGPPARPDVDEGLRAAYGGGRGRLVVASCGVAVGAFLAALVFGASVSALLTTPASYGWPWDIGVMTGSGYGDLDRTAVARALADNPDVASWTELGFTNEVRLDGAPVPTVIAPELRPSDIEMVQGRPPQRSDEIALGARTAADLGLGPGDRASLSGGGIEQRQVRVTGIAVLPPLGQFQSDRTGPGTGLVMPVAVQPGAAELISFAGIRLVPGADPATVYADLRDDLATWDLVGAPPLEYPTPVRPAEIVNVQSMRTVPLLVGGLLAGTAMVGLVVAVVMSVRSRRRELAILQALGFTQRQVRTSVRVQVLATMAAGLIVGVPLGTAAGRVAWQAFAGRLGVIDHPSTPGWWIAATVAGTLLLALATAALPARIAVRISPATTLHRD